MNNRYKWLPHPFVLFVFSMASMALSLFLFIYWYIEVKRGLEELIGRLNFDPLQVFQSRTWVVIIILTLIIGVVFAGIFMSFVYYQKVLQLYRLQQNFINNFTHELKTPVTSLKLYLETFLKHDLSREEQEKYFRYMIHDIGRLSENINSILNLGKIESNEFEGDFVEVDIVAVTKSFYRANAHIFADCDITITNKTNAQLKYQLNIQLFEMLLMNMLTNAKKYNESDRVKIDIIFRKKMRKMIIEFKDNGIGLDKKDLGKIFRKFYQIGKSENMTAKGNGIGLYLVHNIVKIHGGIIYARSRGQGNGSTFTVEFPPAPVIGKWNWNLTL